MYRTAMESLKQWKSRENKKPLLIRGARQVGKTWLMKEFGLKEYAETVYINFDGNRQMKELFSPDFDVDRILIGLELYAGKRILPGETLLVFDEVQEVPDALASLKYFSENAPRHHILCAGLFSVWPSPGNLLSRGEVEFLDLYPLSYTEFLLCPWKRAICGRTEKRGFRPCLHVRSNLHRSAEVLLLRRRHA
jgi:predicted AAA+ superfamily ATPase